MSEPKTRATAAPVAAFLAAQDPAWRGDCEAIVAMMRRATGEAPALWGAAIVGFGRTRVQRADGSAYDWPLVAFSPRKAAISLYVLNDDAPGQAALLGKLGKHTTGKGCLYVKRLADVDTTVLQALIDASVDAHAPRRVRR